MQFPFEKLKLHSFLLTNIVALSLGFSGCSSLQDDVARAIKESPILENLSFSQHRGVSSFPG